MAKNKVRPIELVIGNLGINLTHISGVVAFDDLVDDLGGAQVAGLLEPTSIDNYPPFFVPVVILSSHYRPLSYFCTLQIKHWVGANCVDLEVEAYPLDDLEGVDSH